MDHRLQATREMAQEFSELFVNRRAYTIQSMRPHPEGGRHYYYRPKPTMVESRWRSPSKPYAGIWPVS